MILDKNGKLFGLISLLDVAILLFLIFAAGATIYRFTEKNAQKDFLFITVVATDIPPETAIQLSHYEGDFSDENGILYSVRKKGEVREESPHSPDSFTLRLHLSTLGTEDDTFYRREDQSPIAPGDVLRLQGSNARILMTVEKVSLAQVDK